MLSEQVDRKLLQLRKFKEGQVRGELYEAEDEYEVTMFKDVLPIDSTSRSWGGYEMKYPDGEEATDWTNLHGLVDFVANADALVFREEIGERFDMANAIDYFIFVNLIRATDNTGKNIYVARYEEDAPYFYVPWNLGGSWGLQGDGELMDVTDDMLLNGLYQKLLGLNAQEFRERLSQRWKALRGSVLSDEAIATLISEAQATLLGNNVYEREARAWKEYTYDPASIDYLNSWITRRLTYLDEYFNDPVLSTEGPAQQERVILYPNPANHTLTVPITSHHPMPYQLINIHGVVVQSGTLSADDPTIDVTRLQRGYYILRAEDIAERVLVTD